MKKLLILLPAILLPLPGCIVVRETTHYVTPKKARRDCHPSQYWDGEQCRHKGKGKGARKHDD